MNRTRNFLIGATFVATFIALGVSQGLMQKAASAQAKAGSVQVPRFEVDPTFPKPLPNHWYQGQTIGVSADAQDHIWIIHRADSLSPNEQALDDKAAMCCAKAPPILEFDQQGNLGRHWGGIEWVKNDDYKWPSSNHGITVDHTGNVWIGGNGGDDGMVLKFTKEGKFLLRVGANYPAADSNATDRFWKVAKLFDDAKTNEMYIADGYGNKRVAIIDNATGKMKRFWGAYGNKPDDANTGRYNPTEPLIKQFRTPVHCAVVSNDRIVYVCDRVNDRLQSFTTEGKFIKEVRISPNTLGDGSTWDIAFSKDPQQKFMYLADGHDEKVWILDRDSMEVLTSFGTGGKQPGQFYAVHSIDTDSKGNIYTTETYDGRRVQRFLYKGMQTIAKGTDQGTVWPRTSTN
jgi:hypothetical protein